MGARRRDILAQFLLEAVAISIIGALAGVLLGTAATYVFCRIMDWQAFIAPSTILIAVAFSMGTGLLFGVYPAVYASRMKPIDCLRYE